MQWLSILAALAAASTASGKTLPTLDVHIQPVFNGSSIGLFNTTLKIRDAHLKPNGTLLTFFPQPHFTSFQRYDNHALVASDLDGPLPLIHSNKPGNQQGELTWTAARPTVGDVTVNFLAQPRGKVDNLAGRADLRLDGDGVIGSGKFFLPMPDSNDEWNQTISWTLPSNAPSGTRFATSIGEGTVHDVGTLADVLGQTYFAAGPLQRWPPWDDSDAMIPDDSSDIRHFAMYWIGEFGWDADKLANRAREIYKGTSKYFSDSTSDFRVFCRHDYMSFGGVGAWKSFFIEYADNSPEESDELALENLLSHETIHEFAQLRGPESDADKWFLEGIAEYLKSVAPYTGGTLDKTTFVKWLNDCAQDYYTASPIGRNWTSLTENYWTQGTMVVKAPYTRGMMYLAYVQGLIATQTNNEKSLDDLILKMYRSYQAGNTVTTQMFHDILGDYIGIDAAKDSFEAMTNGSRLVPPADGFKKHGLKMVRKDLDKWFLGINEGSFGEMKVMGLVNGTTAQRSGLKEGDDIVDSWQVWGTSDTYQKNISITVKREDREKTFEYWPRVPQPQEAWHWVEE